MILGAAGITEPMLTLGDDFVHVLAVHLLEQQLDLVILGLDTNCRDRRVAHQSCVQVMRLGRQLAAVQRQSKPSAVAAAAFFLINGFS